MSDKPKPIYVNGLIIREYKFPDGGTQLRVSVNTDELKAFLDGNTGATGWCNLIINRKRNPPQNPKDPTHYATLDTWKPSQRDTTPEPKSSKPSKEFEANPPSDPDGDSVPF